MNGDKTSVSDITIQNRSGEDGRLINILLVEKDKTLTCHVRAVLFSPSQTAKFEIQIAENPAEAVKLLLCESFDIILLELELGDSNKIEAVRKIRSSNPHIPIIVITESADEEAGIQAIKNGADDYLIKGKIFADVLGRGIRYAIERRKERKEAEEQVAIFRRLAEASGEGFCMADFEGKITYVNPQLCTILGEDKPQDITGKLFTSYYPQEMQERLQSDILPAIWRGEKWSGELALVTAEGQIIPTIENIFLIYDEEDKPLCLADVITDITERKKTEKRQAELLDKIKYVNQELQDFAYIISHDLKTPLRGIRTVAKWMESDYADKLDENAKKQLGLLVSRSDRMNKLIDDVLQYSRVGRIREEQTQVNLNELVREVIETIGPACGIEIRIEKELPTIICERTRISQVFQNLIGNAVKHMDKPAGLVGIDCAREDGFWKFSVTDNGPGIEKENFERIFQIFQTLSPQKTDDSTGIGLTVAKKIVEMYGGKIWVESEVGKGSIFFFTLPCTNTMVEVSLETASNG
jgi:PAS domain S-box-containing protein